MTGAGRRPLVLPLLLVALLGACSDHRAPLPLDLPSAGERTFAEKRDFVVAGYFDPPLAHPGDVRIELYRGPSARGTPVRRVESHVDPATGTTPRGALDFLYANGQAWGPNGPVTDPADTVMTPDLVAAPGGIESPWNKVVVTSEYYAGVVLGGASATFDTTYAGEDGVPWTDLDAGTYTILVTGLTGDVAGRAAAERVTFGLTHAMLGRFAPAEHKQDLLAYAALRGDRTYIDFFPGFFQHGGYSYEITGRWMANNSVEVVNTLPGTLVDTVAAAENDVVLYNISASSATQRIEIGTIVANGVLGRTVFHRYGIGEPSLTYVDATTASARSIGGTLLPFGTGERLALTRVEILPDDGVDGENRYDAGDPAPRTVDTDLADGVAADTTCELGVFGVVTPIPSTTGPGPLPHQHEVDDAIRSVAYEIRDGGGAVVLAQVHAVGLDRRYDPVGDPARVSSSIYEFRHEFPPRAAGTYTVTARGLDAGGAPVAGAEVSFSLSVVP